MRCATLVLAALALLLGGGGRARADFVPIWGNDLVEYLPFFGTLDPQYADAGVAAAISASQPTANDGSVGSLDTNFFRVTRGDTPGAVIGTFTLTANPGYSIALTHIMLDVNAPTISSPDFPKFLITPPALDPTHQQFGGYGISNNPNSVSQIDLYFDNPIVIHPGESFVISGQLGTYQVGDSSANFTIASGDYLQFNLVDFVGTVSPETDTVPEPASLTLLAIGGLCAGGYAWRRRGKGVRPPA